MSPDRITLGLAVPAMSAANAYFAVIPPLGYDRDEGLAVDFFYGHHPDRTAAALCAGHCEVASLNTTVGLLGRGRGWPLTAIYGKARRTHRWFAVPPGSLLSRVADLRGKRIACDFEDLRPLAECALDAEGVAPGEVTFVPWRGSGMEARGMIGPLRRGEVDAAFIIDWNAGDFVAEDLPLRRLPSRALDAITLSSCLWSTEAHVDTHPRQVAGFGRAFARATVFCLGNPEAAVRLMWRDHPETRAGMSEERCLRRDLAILSARLDSMRLDGAADPRWGAMRSDAVAWWREFLLAGGFLRERLDLRACYTAAHVDAYNTFTA